MLYIACYMLHVAGCMLHVAGCMLPPLGRSRRIRTGCTADIVEGELGDAGVELQQEGQWLTDATGSTENSDLGELCKPASGVA